MKCQILIAPDKSKAPGQTGGFMEVVYEEDYIHKLNLKWHIDSHIYKPDSRDLSRPSDFAAELLKA